MASIWQKIRTLTLGNLHELLDAAIDLNSVAACKQYVRDLEEAKDKMRDEAAAARGRLGQSQAAVATLEHQIETDTEGAQLLLDDGDDSNDGDAQKLMEGVVQKQELLETKKAQLATDKQVADALGDAVRKITSKHAEMVNNVRRLESLEQQTKAQEQATAALKQAGKIANSTDGVSVDNVEQRLRDRAAASSEKFKDAMADVSGGSVQESLQSAKAKQLIAQMRAKKAGTAAGGAAGG
ncbi:MAG TPA: PspA/IM30 family protein [Candidatus Binatia bacterium]|jgi:phage shock protein A|nr:PspA/IM30 family protein [Candidatus Binatia bacterium]